MSSNEFAYVEGLLDAYTVPSSVFLGTILCSINLSSARTLITDDPLVEGVNEEDGDAPTPLRSRTEAGLTCLLPKLNLGDATTLTLMKTIAAFTGVRCQEFCRVPWSHVKTAAHKLGSNPYH